MELPDTISGRTRTVRGSHAQPFGYHAFWCKDTNTRQSWLDRMVSMGLSWLVVLTEGDSILESFGGLTVYEHLLKAGIIPLVREKVLYPRSFTNWQTVERCARISEQYGLPGAFWLCRNEPADDREHVGGKAPNYPAIWDLISRFWAEDASIVIQSGGIPGFPDGPSYPSSPFVELDRHDGNRFFKAGQAFYAGHYYGKGRPANYPYDVVTQTGYEHVLDNQGQELHYPFPADLSGYTCLDITEAEWRAQLDDYAHDPSWYDAPLEMSVTQRHEWAWRGCTIMEDDVSFRAWEKIKNWSLSHLGFSISQAMTEGGWCPRDRAGSAPVDMRWPYTTPYMVASKTLAVMDDSEHGMFAVCPWLLADTWMGGAGAWESDAWCGGAWHDNYGFEKPIVKMLQDNPPDNTGDNATDKIIDASLDLLGGMFSLEGGILALEGAIEALEGG